MTTSLREPFFLRGRTSVLQRAVIISCVLAGLTAAAGWISAIAEVALGQMAPAPMGVMCLAVAVLVHGPLHRWNRRSWLWTLAAFPASFGLLLVFSLWLRLGANALGSGSRILVVSLGMLGITAGSGLLQFRFRRLHLLAYIFSLLSVLLPTAVLVILNNSAGTAIPGFTNDMVRGFLISLQFGSGIAAIAIPWGLPFWWPPADDHSPAPPVQLHADLLD